MADLSEEQENKEIPESRKDAQKGPEKRSKSGLWFGLVILLVILGLAGGGYMLLQQIREKQEGLGGQISKDDTRLMELTKQITGYQAQLAAIQTQIANLDSDISGKDDHYNKKLADFSELHGQKMETMEEALKKEVKQIQRQLGKTRGDWLIADAEYLLSVANQRLHLTGDVNTTLEALEAADQRLRESGDAGVFKVREQLTREIAQIRQIELPDIVGLYSELDNLENSIENLTLFLPFSGKQPGQAQPEPKQIGEQPETAGNDTESDSTADELLDSALEGLEELVTIRYTKTPIKEILTVEEVYFIKQQLMVRLEMAKLSLVQRNDTLYKANLADAKKWLLGNFADDLKTASFAKELDNLAEISLHSQLPDISQSLKMLRDVTKLRLETDKALSGDDSELEEKTAKPVPEMKALSDEPVNTEFAESNSEAVTDTETGPVEHETVSEDNTSDDIAVKGQPDPENNAD